MKRSTWFFAGTVALGFGSSGWAGPISDVVAVEHIGGDTSVDYGGLASKPVDLTGQAVFIDTFVDGGTRIQTIPLPTTDVG